MPPKGFTNDAIPALSACQSPIEGKFIQAFFDVMKERGFSTSYASQDDIWKIQVLFDSESSNIRYELCVRSAPHLLGGMSLDTGVAVVWGKIIQLLAVELDGEAFHKSKEQRDRDRIKDRRMLVGMCPVVRFSGSEIYQDSKSCVHEVLRIGEEFVRHRIDEVFESWVASAANKGMQDAR